MATAHSELPVRTDAREANGLVSIGKLASATGLHPSTIRRLDQHLPGLTLPSGHRRYRLAEVLSLLARKGLIGEQQGESGNGTGTVPICCVARVSTSKDQQKVSLGNQKQRLVEYVAREFGSVATTLFWNERIASGLNLSHQKVLELVDLILSGKLDGGFILCCFKDRIARYGWEVFERLCQLRNIQLRFIDELDRKTEAEELQSDLLSILTCFTAKANGMKARKLYAVQIDEDTSSLIYELRTKKLSSLQIADYLKQHGKHLDQNGREIREQTIYRFLRRTGKVGRKLARFNAELSCATSTSTGDSFSRFLAEKLVREEGYQPYKAIYDAYRSFCTANGLVPLAKNLTARTLRQAGYRLKLRNGYLMVYAGLRAG